ncbi:protein transport protein sec31 like protein b [Quercus suber]|uniref:Protein transport protein sec31 like protein b n=1 Tax=Quercus suber TaxID=58331 RepID=A0AAW0LUS5_QUESU
MADALVIANVGGASLWESTQDQCFKISRSPYLKVVSAMVNNDLLSLIFRDFFVSIFSLSIGLFSFPTYRSLEIHSVIKQDIVPPGLILIY